MSDLYKNGGPVFPVDAAMRDGYGQPIDFPGMSLRDWMAGQALVGIASISVDGFSMSPQDEAAWAYQRADAMLAARKEESTQ